MRGHRVFPAIATLDCCLQCVVATVEPRSNDVVRATCGHGPSALPRLPARDTLLFCIVRRSSATADSAILLQPPMSAMDQTRRDLANADVAGAIYLRKNIYLLP